MKSQISILFNLFLEYWIEPLIQRARGTCGDSRPKDGGSKASAGMYRTRQLPVGVGLANRNPRLTNMNSWLKPREKRAAKGKLSSPKFGTRSQTKKATASGARGGNSRAKFGQRMPGVKREPKGSIDRSWYGTPETLLPAYSFSERRGEIGMKRMLWVTPEIGLLVDPKGCPLPVTSRIEEMRGIYP